MFYFINIIMINVQTYDFIISVTFNVNNLTRHFTYILFTLCVKLFLKRNEFVIIWNYCKLIFNLYTNILYQFMKFSYLTFYI